MFISNEKGRFVSGHFCDHFKNLIMVNKFLVFNLHKTKTRKEE